MDESIQSTVVVVHEDLVQSANESRCGKKGRVSAYDASMKEKKKKRFTFEVDAVVGGVR